MMALIVSLSLTCPVGKVINKTNVWTKMDAANLHIAIKRCPKLYPDAPCVKVFEKREEMVYRVICGRIY